MELVGAVACAVLVLFGLYLKYRDRGNKRRQEEDESNPG
jgi:hypothetical protein